MARKINNRGYKSWRKLDRDDVRKINESCDRFHPAHSRKNCIHRVRSRNKKLNIPKLVYKFLGNVASLESENNEANSTRSHAKRSGIKKCKKPERNPDAVHVATNRKSVDESTTSISTCRSTDTNSTICTIPSTPGSTKSGIQTKQKFSIQAIKDYIKAGIAEGKRRAKKYMCKALSFGVDTGYLIPTKPDGQVLRVSSALVSFTGQKDKGERGIRQKLRRGDATCTSKERKLLRRRVDPVSQKRPRSPSSVGSNSTSSKTQSSRPKIKKPKYGNRIRKHKTKRAKNPKKFKRGSGRPKGRVNSAKIKLEKSCPTVELDDEESSTRNGKKILRKETLTPSRSEEDNAKSIKKEKPSDPSIQENYSKGTESRVKEN